MFLEWNQCSPLSLVEGQRCFALIGWILLLVLLHQHPYVIKNQLKTSKAAWLLLVLYGIRVASMHRNNLSYIIP